MPNLLPLLVGCALFLPVCSMEKKPEILDYDTSFIDKLLVPVEFPLEFPCLPSPLHPCLFENNTFIKCGAGKTTVGFPLHETVDFDSPRLIHYLVKYLKVDPSMRDENGDTALHSAVRARKFHAVKALLLYSVDLVAKNNNDETPLSLAGTNKKFRKILKNKLKLLAKERICKKIKLESGV